MARKLWAANGYMAQNLKPRLTGTALVGVQILVPVPIPLLIHDLYPCRSLERWW